MIKKRALNAIIVGIVTVIVGIFICLFALLTASATNQKLFKVEKNNDGNIVYTYDLASQNISSLVLDLSGDVKVNILSSDKDYVEFINFPHGTYNTRVSTRICNINDNLDILAMLGMSGESDFGGMRNMIYNMLFSEKNREINIYLSPRSSINSVTVKADSDVTLESLVSHTDIYVHSHQSNIDVLNSQLSSFVSLTGANITTESSVFSNLEISSGKGEIYLDGISAQSCKATANNGNIHANIECTQEQLSICANCRSGTVTINSQAAGHSLSLLNPGASQSFELNCKNGSININTTD
jgi:hypothetical protein